MARRGKRRGHPERATVARAGSGLAPKHWEAVIGQRVRVAVRRNNPVRDEVLPAYKGPWG